MTDPVEGLAYYEGPCPSHLYADFHCPGTDGSRLRTQAGYITPYSEGLVYFRTLGKEWASIAILISDLGHQRDLARIGLVVTPPGFDAGWK